MRHFQIFPFSADGRLCDAVALDFETDVRAIRHAIDGGFPNGCELWEGFRFIGRFHGAVPAMSEARLTRARRPARDRSLVH